MTGEGSSAYAPLACGVPGARGSGLRVQSRGPTRSGGARVGNPRGSRAAFMIVGDVPANPRELQLTFAFRTAE